MAAQMWDYWLLIIIKQNTWKEPAIQLKRNRLE